MNAFDDQAASSTFSRPGRMLSLRHRHGTRERRGVIGDHRREAAGCGRTAEVPPATNAGTRGFRSGGEACGTSAAIGSAQNGSGSGDARQPATSSSGSRVTCAATSLRPSIVTREASSRAHQLAAGRKPELCRPPCASLAWIWRWAESTTRSASTRPRPRAPGFFFRPRSLRAWERPISAVRDGLTDAENAAYRPRWRAALIGARQLQVRIALARKIWSAPRESRKLDMLTMHWQAIFCSPRCERRRATHVERSS